MSLNKTNFLIFLSFFPIFVFRSNFSQFEIFSTIVVFLTPFLFLNYLIIEKNLLNKKILKLYFSIIVVVGIDNNLGLWNGLIQPFRYLLIDIFKIIYIPAILFYLVSTLSLFFLIYSTDEKFQKVIIVFLISIFLFNGFDQTKSYKKLKNFSNYGNKIHKNTNVIIIFDEMSGLDSLASNDLSGSEFNQLAIEFFKKYDFEFYSKIKSFSGNSVDAISSLVNFSKDKNLRSKVTSISQNYFYEYEMNKNLLFKKFNNISVYQNIHLDYCLFENVLKCETYDPFNQKIFLNGFKNTYLTKMISIWKLNGSIISTIVWRSLRQLRIIDSILEPEGHKISFNDFFKKIKKDVYSQKFDLIFAHTLVPHKPYGFNKECSYDGTLSLGNIFFSKDQHIIQHNVERKCVFQYLDLFLSDLNNEGFLNKINLTILSDHGSRITKKDDSYLSVFYGNKNINTYFKEFDKETTSQDVFSNQFNN